MRNLTLLGLLSLGLLVADITTPLLPDALAQEAAPVREIAIHVEGGYQPSQVTVAAGERVRLIFTRTEYSSCTKEVVIPALGIRKELPPHQPVSIDLPALAAGEYAFHCGMNMIHGTITVTGG